VKPEFHDENTKNLRIIMWVLVAALIAFTITGFKLLSYDAARLLKHFPHYYSATPIDEAVREFFFVRIIIVLFLMVLLAGLHSNSVGVRVKHGLFITSMVVVMASIGYLQGMLLIVKPSLLAYTVVLFGLMAFTYIPVWLSTFICAVGFVAAGYTMHTFARLNPEYTNVLVYFVILSLLSIAISKTNFKRRLRELSQERELEVALSLLGERNKVLEKKSDRDAMTEITNRGYFDKMLGEVVHNPSPFAVIMIDVDNFKKFNDTYGHVAGDDCLRRVAQAITGALCRDGDSVSRYGGEEFGVILQATTVEGARSVAERIRQNIRALGIPHEKSAAGVVTVSLGVAVIPRAGQMSLTEVVEQADKCLYESKEYGRDRVTVKVVEVPA